MFKVKSFKKGYSLVEIMIVLGIISTVLVGSVSTLLRASYELRNNEIEDTANAIVLKASEFLKSPLPIRMLNNTSPNIAANNNMFNLVQDATTNELFVSLNTRNDFGAKCDANNSFNVKKILGDEFNIMADICMQIQIVQNPTDNDQADYSFAIRTKYTLGNREVDNTYFGYRYEAITN